MKPGSMLCLEVGIPGLSGFPDRKAEGCIRRPLSVQKAAALGTAPVAADVQTVLLTVPCR